MKIKKLMSIGAIALTLACSTSIGASAAEKTLTANDLQTALKKMIVSQYTSGAIKLPEGRNTSIGDILTTDNMDTLKGYLENYDFGDKVLDKYGKDTTLVDGVVAINDKNLATLKGRNLQVSLDEIKTDKDYRIQAEKDIRTAIDNINEELIKASDKGDNKLEVSFGLNKDGKTTGTVTQNNKVILQLNIDDLQTAINTLNTLSSVNDQKTEVRTALNK